MINCRATEIEIEWPCRMNFKNTPISNAYISEWGRVRDYV